MIIQKGEIKLKLNHLNNKMNHNGLKKNSKKSLLSIYSYGSNARRWLYLSQLDEEK